MHLPRILKGLGFVATMLAILAFALSGVWWFVDERQRNEGWLQEDRVAAEAQDDLLTSIVTAQEDMTRKLEVLGLQVEELLDNQEQLDVGQQDIRSALANSQDDLNYRIGVLSGALLGPTTGLVAGREN